MIYAAQFRAARALLDWSLTKSAREAQVSVSAVVNAERHDRDGQEDRSDALRSAYEKAGVRFLDGETLGVAMAVERKATQPSSDGDKTDPQA